MVADTTFNVGNEKNLLLTVFVATSASYGRFPPIFYVVHYEKSAMVYQKIFHYFFQTFLPKDPSDIRVTVDHDEAILTGYISARWAFLHKKDINQVGMSDVSDSAQRTLLQPLRGCYFHFTKAILKCFKKDWDKQDKYAKSVEAARTLCNSASKNGFHSEAFGARENEFLDTMAHLKGFAEFQQFWKIQMNGLHWNLLFDIGPGTKRSTAESTSNGVQDILKQEIRAVFVSD